MSICCGRAVSDVHTVHLQEYEEQTVEGITPEQAQQLHVRFGKVLDVRMNWSGQIVLKASQHVGVIVLDDLRIHIRPKVDLTNLFFMLTYAYDLPRLREEQAQLDMAEDLYEFIVAIFVQQVEGLVRQGIHQAYIDREEVDPFLRGRLMMAEHLRHNAGVHSAFYQRRNDFTPDILENRILLHTLHHLSRHSYQEATLTHRLRRTQSAFSMVQPRPIGPDDCDRVHYTRLNEVYRTPVGLAKLLLQHLSVEGTEGKHHFFAFLFDMNQLFELFVARYLERSFAQHPRYRLDIQHQIWLDADHKEKGKPDIWIEADNRPLLILDTKYKTFDGSPSESDRNQMIVYCHTQRMTHSLLIYADPAPVHYRASFHGIWLEATTLSLSGDLAQLRHRCSQFLQTITDRCDRLAIGIASQHQ